LDRRAGAPPVAAPNRAPSADLCEEGNRRADTNPLRAFDCKNPACKEIMGAAPLLRDELCDDCREHYAAVKSALDRRQLAAAWQQEGEKWSVPVKVMEEDVYNPLFALRGEAIRQPERQLLDELLVSMEKKEFDEAKGVIRFTAEEKAAVETAVAALRTTDAEKLDAEVFKGLKTIVLPREVTVVGVYQATMMVITPDLFVPLPLAQGLAGTEDRAQGVALRLDDAYAAERVAEEGRKLLGDDLAFITWGEQFKAFFSVISQQRVMLYFVLSFIALVSAFSMMAVMFTVTIQKRREIGVMKARCPAPGQIVRVFLY